MKSKIKNKFKALISALIMHLIIILNCCPLKTYCHTNRSLSLTATCAILVDEETGQVLYQKASDEKRSCASITKIMTVLLVMEALKSKKIKLEDKINISEHASLADGSGIFLKENESMALEDLLKAAVVASANDAAVALAEHIYGTEENFVKKMNQKAKDLGMTNTTFKNCTGLTEEGHVSTAKDISIMARELLKYKEILKYTSIWMKYLRNGKTQIVNTNKLLKSYEGITGLKTGTTDEAGFCMCASAQRKNISLIAVILGADTSENRFKESAALLDYGFENFTKVTPKTENVVLKPLKISKGIKPEINLEIFELKTFLVPIGKEKEVKAFLELKDHVVSPILRGKVLGKFIYKLKDDTLAEHNIVASENVEKATFWNVFKKMLKHAFS